MTIALLIFNLVMFGQDVMNTSFSSHAVLDSNAIISMESNNPDISSLSKRESVTKFANMAPGLLVSPIQAADNQAIIIDAYSMPSSYMLYIQVEGHASSELSCTLFDNAGKFVKQQKLGGINTELCLEEYPSGKYFVKIVQTGKDLKTFEVYKK